MDFNIDFKNVKEKIKKTNAKNVLIQLPDGVKEKYSEFEEKLKIKNVNIMFWAGSCFGACDIPTFTKEIGIDLIIHFGHSEFKTGEW